MGESIYSVRISFDWAARAVRVRPMPAYAADVECQGVTPKGWRCVPVNFAWHCDLDLLLSLRREERPLQSASRHLWNECGRARAYEWLSRPDNRDIIESRSAREGFS